MTFVTSQASLLRKDLIFKRPNVKPVVAHNVAGSKLVLLSEEVLYSGRLSLNNSCEIEGG